MDSQLNRGAWDVARHRAWLSRLLGAHEPIEAGLDQWWAGTTRSLSVPAWPARRRTHLLWLDLRALGVTDAEIQALPRPTPPPVPLNLPEVLGRLYVLDGIALGGAAIAARASAGGVPSSACRSLLLRDRNARCWRETRSFIENLAAPEAARTARAAAELFDLFEGWLDESGPARARSYAQPAGI